MTILKARKLLVFDLDKTLVLDNSSFAFCKHLIRRGVLPVSTLLYSFCYYVCHHFFGMGLSQLHTRIFRSFLKGKPLSLIQKEVEIFLDRYLPHRLCPLSYAALVRGRLSGHYILILSNSPGFLVGAVADRLGVDAYASTDYLVDRKGRLSEIAHVLEGQDKALCAKQTAQRLSIPLEDMEAYSDSILDEPLLSLAGKAIAVNPDRKLRRLCRVRSWSILSS